MGRKRKDEREFERLKKERTIVFFNTRGLIFPLCATIARRIRYVEPAGSF